MVGKTEEGKTEESKTRGLRIKIKREKSSIGVANDKASTELSAPSSTLESSVNSQQTALLPKVWFKIIQYFIY